MNKNDMNLILQDVRKAYRLLADYQQRIIELITFIKKELDIEHFSYYFPNYYTLRYIDKIYNGESEIVTVKTLEKMTALLEKVRWDFEVFLIEVLIQF